MEGKARKASRNPFDYDTMKKGDRFGPEVIEPIVNVKRKTYEYPLKLAQIVQQIERELWSRGKRYTVRSLNHGVAILTDVEASAYNADRFKHHIAGLVKSNLKLSCVEADELDETKRKEHDKHIRDQGAILSAIVAARKRTAPVASSKPDGQIAG